MAKIDRSGWHIGDVPDPEYQSFIDEIQQVIINRITNQIQHHPDLKIIIGPHHQTSQGTRHPVLFTLNMLGKQLEVNIKDQTNLAVHLRGEGGSICKSGFRLLKTGQAKNTYSLSGLVSYINTEWIPQQKSLVKRAKNRQGAADELTEALAEFTSQKIQQKDLSPLLRSVMRRWYGGCKNENDTLEYHIITNKASRKSLDTHAQLSYWGLGQQKVQIQFLWVALKKNQNMVQLGYLYPETSQWGIAHRDAKSNWFSPKNLVAQLDKLAKKAPKLAILLADPDLKKE